MDRARSSVITPLLFTLLAVFIALVLAPTRLTAVFRDLLGKPPAVSTGLISPTANMAVARTPVYFLSHGGPNIMYDKAHPVFSKLQEIGREITQKVRPKAVVVFSAHWQGEPNIIEINTSENTDLIYDFYGFPDHYYKEKYPHKGSTPVAEKVIGVLNQAGIKSEPIRRGLDHGVWASFKVAFDPDTNPLSVPIVQVSLFASDDPHQHYALGRAVARLREQGILIIVSGMAVHNLRDMAYARMSPGALAYAVSFDAALKEAVEGDAEGREDRMAALLRRSDARKAHPTFEHLLPIHVGAGAAGADQGKRLWTLAEGSFSWAQYRFGDVEGAKSEL